MLNKLWRVLSPRLKRRLPLLLLAHLLVSVFEVFGVAAILPFMMLVSKPQLVEAHPTLRHLYVLVGSPSRENFILGTGLLVLATLALGNLVGAGNLALSLRIVGTEHSDLSHRLLTKYLARPYSWFLSRNTALLGRNVLSEIGTIPFAILLPLLRLFSRFVVVVLILSGLVYLNPAIALLTSAGLGLAYVGVWLLARGQLVGLGKERLMVEAERYRIAVEALQGIKTTIVLGREKTFLGRYKVEADRAAYIQAQQGILNETPRYVLETLAFGGVVCIILVLVVQQRDLRDVMPLISVFTVGAYRLMPALQQGFTYFACIRTNLPALDHILSEYSDIEGEDRDLEPSSPLCVNREIALDSIQFAYGDGPPVVNGISLTIPKNHSIALVGSTGSGKTTLMDILLGLLRPQGGGITVDGVAIDGNRLRSWQANVGYVSQDIFLLDDTIAANIAYGVADENIDMEAVRRAARLANLDDFVTRDLPLRYRTLVGERGVRLSGGQRQRIGIARALYGDPQVLIFDEATSSLDGVTENSVMEAIRSLSSQKTIILVAHRLSTVQECHQIYYLESGRIADQGTFTELLNSNPVFRQMAKATALEKTTEVKVLPA